MEDGGGWKIVTTAGGWVWLRFSACSSVFLLVSMLYFGLEVGILLKLVLSMEWANYISLVFSWDIKAIGCNDVRQRDFGGVVLCLSYVLRVVVFSVSLGLVLSPERSRGPYGTLNLPQVEVWQLQ